MSGGMAIGMFASLTPPLMAITAGILALILALQQLYALSPLKRFDDAKKAVEDMKSAVNEAQEAATRAAEAYKNLSDVLDGLEDREKSINRLAEGTLE